MTFIVNVVGSIALSVLYVVMRNECGEVTWFQQNSGCYVAYNAISLG